MVVSGKVPNFGIADKITTPIHEEIAEPGCKDKSYLRCLFTSCIKPAQTETKRGAGQSSPSPALGSPVAPGLPPAPQAPFCSPRTNQNHTFPHVLPRRSFPLDCRGNVLLSSGTLLLLENSFKSCDPGWSCHSPEYRDRCVVVLSVMNLRPKLGQVDFSLKYPF